MIQRHSVPSWTKAPLQASTTMVGTCEGVLNLVGMDFHAHDGSVFAHAHWDVDIAERVVAEMTRAIAEARRKAAN